jgi:hypothetical protein
VPRRLFLNMCQQSEFVVNSLCRRDCERDVLAVDLLGAAQGGSSLPRREASRQPRSSRPRLLIVPASQPASSRGSASQQPRSSQPATAVQPASNRGPAAPVSL